MITYMKKSIKKKKMVGTMIVSVWFLFTIIIQVVEKVNSFTMY